VVEVGCLLKQIETGSTDMKALRAISQLHNGNSALLSHQICLTLTTATENSAQTDARSVAQIDIDPDVPILVAPAISESLATLV